MSLILMPLLLAGTATVKIEPPPTITGDTGHALTRPDTAHEGDPGALATWPHVLPTSLNPPPELVIHHGPGTRQRRRRQLERQLGRRVAR